MCLPAAHYVTGKLSVYFVSTSLSPKIVSCTNRRESNGEVVSVQVMKVHGGKEVQFHVFVINTLHWGEKVGFTPRPFFLSGKSAHCPLNTQLGEPYCQPSAQCPLNTKLGEPQCQPSAHCPLNTKLGEPQCQPSAHCPLNTKLGEPQCQPERFIYEIILKLLLEFEPRSLGCPVGSVVTVATAPSRFTGANRGHPVQQTVTSTSMVRGNV